jgi:hypothetical protein
MGNQRPEAGGVGVDGISPFPRPPIVMSAKAGIHDHGPCPVLLNGCSWIPVFAGMTAS